MLQSRHKIELSESETLDRLVDADCGDYRMSDLADDIYLSQSALSRVVARLERDGLVRPVCATTTAAPSSTEKSPVDYGPCRRTATYSARSWR